MLLAGTLRDRVTIEGPTQTQDPVTGDITTSWGSFAAGIPANIQPLSAREFIAAGAIQGDMQAKIIIRWQAGITDSMRVVDDALGTIYNIRGVLADNRTGREWITLIVGQGLSVDGS